LLLTRRKLADAVLIGSMSLLRIAGTGRLRLPRFRPKRPRRVALRPIGAGEFALPNQLFGAQFRVLQARERCQKSYNVVDLGLAQRKRLNIFVEIRIVYAVALQGDVAAIKRVLALQSGPCILVAHSYGGAVITEAGNEPSVAGLVHIAAHMPDAGESEADDGKRFPSDLSKSDAIKKTADGFTYLDPAQFHEYFAADLSADQTAFMARSQVLNFADNFRPVITTPAWKSKPSWMLVATKDRTIDPDLERWYATRAKSRKVEVAGASHSVYVSRPKEVAALIEEAASSSHQ
jgi:hypothetical protein